MHKHQRKYIEKKYRQWLIDSAKFKEIPREERNNMKIEQDKNTLNTTFDSLQID